MPAAPTPPKQPTRLSPRGLAAYRAGFGAGLAGFAAACVGLFLLSDYGAASALADTPLAARFRAVIQRSPFLIGALFNVSMFASVLTLIRLQEHAAAPAVPPPKSRQERRARERDFKSAVARLGGRIVEPGSKLD